MTDTGRHQPPLRLTRADLDALPNYVPGRSPADLARELGLPEAIKLASSGPYGTSLLASLIASGRPSSRARSAGLRPGT